MTKEEAIEIIDKMLIVNQREREAVDVAIRSLKDMGMDEYQSLAQRTANKSLSAAEHIENGVLGLCGEAGEVVDLYKKYRFQGHGLNHQSMGLELSDCMWYAAELSSGLGFRLSQLGRANIAKLMDRYPDGFEPEKSIHRKEGDQE